MEESCRNLPRFIFKIIRYRAFAYPYYLTFNFFFTVLKKLSELRSGSTSQSGLQGVAVKIAYFALVLLFRKFFNFPLILVKQSHEYSSGFCYYFVNNVSYSSEDISERPTIERVWDGLGSILVDIRRPIRSFGKSVRYLESGA